MDLVCQYSIVSFKAAAQFIGNNVIFVTETAHRIGIKYDYSINRNTVRDDLVRTDQESVRLSCHKALVHDSNSYLATIIHN